jgi:hypothetical protein
MAFLEYRSLERAQRLSDPRDLTVGAMGEEADMSKAHGIARDVRIVAGLDGTLVVLVCIYIWLIHRVFTGMASIPVAVTCGIIALVCTVVAGAKIDRLIVGILGMAALWTCFALLDLSTSSASLSDEVRYCLVFLSVQVAVLVFAHYLARW